MNTITIFASATLLVACYVSLAESACYLSNTCFDVETNKTYKAGENWVTPQCTRCDCTEQKQNVKLCLELLPRIKSVKKSKITAQFETDSENDNGLFHETFISQEAAVNFKCPPVSFDFYADTMPSFRFVNYVTMATTMGCCTVGRPVSIPSFCQAVLNRQTCQYKVYMKNTKIPCQGPMSFVGK
uniref:Uncharacterized protein LOC100183996 n=1 Tax=Phallusia mammillata TaxID=59560 RepID=A0A6F9DII6_9ASCI|nr:uncharacterized protein LOC100183996 [Phallusia mammillata]